MMGGQIIRMMLLQNVTFATLQSTVIHFDYTPNTVCPCFVFASVCQRVRFACAMCACVSPCRLRPFVCLENVLCVVVFFFLNLWGLCVVWCGVVCGVWRVA